MWKSNDNSMYSNLIYMLTAYAFPIWISEIRSQQAIKKENERKRADSKQPNILSVQFSLSVMSDSLRPHESQYARPPCPSPTPGVHPNSCTSSGWCHPAISSSVVPFSSCPQFCPASGSFPMNRLFTSGGQSTGASASVPPMNIQGQFPLGLIALISLLSKGLLKVFSSTTIRKHQIFGFQPIYGPTLISIHDYWKNCSFDYTYLCRQRYVSAF